MKGRKSFFKLYILQPLLQGLEISVLEQFMQQPPGK